MTKCALGDALELAGGQTQLAKKINIAIDYLVEQSLSPEELKPRKVRQNVIWKWLNNYKSSIPPAEYVIPIEIATGIPREKLRPDLYVKIEKTQAA
ncbi:hypothetical protein MAH1_33650 [Sessilibacter sp. MAH1]